MSKQRAKIIFYPRNGEQSFCLDQLQIIEKSSNWTYDTSDFVEDGYVYTNEEDSISIINNNYWMKLKAKEGYKINSCFRTNATGIIDYGDIVISEDGIVTIYPWQTGSNSIVNNHVKITVIEDVIEKCYVTPNINNCTGDYLLEYVSNTPVQITLVASDGCLFDVVPEIITDNDTIPFIVSQDKQTATISFTITSNIIINASATQYYKLTTNLINCDCDTNVLKGGIQSFTLTSYEGYEFSGSVSIEDTVTHTTTYVDHYTEDHTVCEITYDVKGDLIVTATAIKKTEQISRFSNLYLIDNDILDELSFKRMINTDNGVFDYGSFINDLYILPFQINNELIGDSSSIWLGNHNTDITTPTLSKYIYLINMGTIRVPEKYENIYDYKNTECVLHLPFMESINLKVEHVINHTITIFYKIDMYTGRCTANIYSDSIDDNIASISSNISHKIPFVQSQNESIVNSLNIFVDNDVTIPFIEVIRNIPYDVNSIFGNETVDFGILQNYKGYLRVSDILLNVHATNEEKEEIENLLKNGVFINEISIDNSNEI